MQNSVNRIKTVIAHGPACPVPKGELWLGTDLLDRAGFTDTLENHFRLVAQLGQDMVCLPVADSISSKPALGYRYFNCADLKEAVRSSDRFVAAVVDGPFQELANQMGLMAVLTGWVQMKQNLVTAYAIEQSKVMDLIRRCLDQGVHAVVMADDLASDQALFMSPADIEMLCAPFYTRAVPLIHGAGAWAFLHSCGRILQLMPLIKAWQIDGLASVQHQTNNLPVLAAVPGPPLVIMGGIDAELLMSDSPLPGVLTRFQRMVNSLAPGGGLILSSSCGLYSGDFMVRIQTLYAMADRLTRGVSC